MRRALWIAICLLAVGNAFAAEIVRLDEHNWHRAPRGKEVDAIYGDYLLTSDQLIAVVGDTISNPLRVGSTMLADARGILIDLTPAAANNDQLTAFNAGWQVAYSSAVVLQAAGPSVCLRVIHPPTAKEPFLVETDYSLTDGQPYLMVTTRVQNTGTAPLKGRTADKLRAEGNYSQGAFEQGEAWWAYDRWYHAAYAVTAEKGRITGTAVTGREKGTRLEYPEALPGGVNATVPPGGEVRWSRRVLAARDLLEVGADVRSLWELPSKAAEITVTEEDGRPIANAHLTVMQGDRQLLAGATRADGRARVTLTPGAYTLVVSAEGRPEQSLALDLSDDRQLAVKLPPAAMVAITITDEQGGPLPCKVQFLPVSPEMPVPEFGPGCATFGVKNIRYTENGRVSQALLPGAYDVVISRGPEYDALFRRVQVTAGNTVSIAGCLRRVVDTRGWIASDLHGHTTESGDNFAEVTGRVLNLAAEGVEFAPSSDHVRIVPWGPAIEELGLQRFLATVDGEEISGPGAKTHQNAFPLRARLHTVNNGGIPQGGDLDTQVSRIAAWDNHSEKLIQLNHPNVVSCFFDKDGDGKFDGGYRVAARLLHAVEAMGNPLDSRSRAYSWLRVLNQGIRLTGVANTDTHNNFHGSGMQRNFIRCSTDEPSRINPMEIVHQLKAGHAVMSTGPFLEATVGKALPGDTVVARNGKVRLRVRVQCANWVDINRVQILVNGRPDPALNFTRLEQPELFRGGVVRFEHEIPVTLTGDAHLIVVAVGEGLSLAPVMGGQGGRGVPLAVSNPFYVDVDGGGFQANGDLLGLKLN